jgi:putative transposase
VKKKRFSVEQITSVLQQVASGVPVGDVCRQVGISEQTFYRWKKAYGSMLPSEARELKQLRDENTKLKRLVADLSLDKVMLQDIVQKSSKARPAARSGALLDGPVRGQRTTGDPGGALLSVQRSLSEPPRSADGAAATDARAGADTRTIRLSPAAGAAAPRRLGARQETVLSPLHRGRIGAATKTTLASRDGGPPRAATPRDGPQ